MDPEQPPNTRPRMRGVDEIFYLAGLSEFRTLREMRPEIERHYTSCGDIRDGLESQCPGKVYIAAVRADSADLSAGILNLDHPEQPQKTRPRMRRVNKKSYLDGLIHFTQVQKSEPETVQHYSSCARAHDGLESGCDEEECVAAIRADSKDLNTGINLIPGYPDYIRWNGLCKEDKLVARYNGEENRHHQSATGGKHFGNLVDCDKTTCEGTQWQVETSSGQALGEWPPSKQGLSLGPRLKV